MEEAGERGGEKRKGDAPQVSKVSNEIRVYKNLSRSLLTRRRTRAPEGRA